MDLGASLANLSLAEIASMLNTKQQEVLLASISVAARFIQQLQAEEQLQAQEEQQLQQQEEQEQHQQQEQQHMQQQQQQQQPPHLHQQQHQQQQHHHRLQQQLLHNNNNNNNNHNINDSATTCDSISINNLSHYDDDDDTQDDEDDEDDEDLMMMQEHHGHHVNDYSSTTDAQTLLKIREFAEELKHRRKSIRLSQKGAAQSLRAFTNGDQPCTDAIIYHFENLQLEPDRAMALIPLLKDWLEWAEKHRLTGKSLPMLCAVTKVPRERKRKVVLFNEKAKQYLEDAFVKNNHPDRYQLDVISQELNIPTRSIRKWFTNRRQRKRFAEKFSPLS